MKEYKDHSNRLNIDLPTGKDQYADLETYEEKIHTEFNTKTIQKVDDLDLFYWDFDFGENTLVLHLEHFMGISIHMNGKQNDELLRTIYQKITNT